MVYNLNERETVIGVWNMTLERKILHAPKGPRLAVPKTPRGGAPLHYYLLLGFSLSEAVSEEGPVGEFVLQEVLWIRLPRERVR